MDESGENMLGLINARGNLKLALHSVWSAGTHVNLETYIDPPPKIDALFIDWIPRKDQDRFAIQGIYVEHYAKAGVPIVIFDRYVTMNQNEYSWLRKFNITFCEPLLSCRTGFHWLPIWSENFKPKKRESSRYILTGPLTNENQFDFDKYYKKTAELFPSKSVSYTRGADIYDTKVDSLKQMGIEMVSQPVYENSASTILIGSDVDYRFGGLPDNFFDIMKCGCVPLLPIEHRFYCSMFNDLVVAEDNDLIFLVDMSERLSEVLIEELLENIFKRYPEFKIEYTVERIREWLK
jgi:hypothetical protein